MYREKALVLWPFTFRLRQMRSSHLHDSQIPYLQMHPLAKMYLLPQINAPGPSAVMRDSSKCKHTLHSFLAEA